MPRAVFLYLSLQIYNIYFDKQKNSCLKTNFIYAKLSFFDLNQKFSSKFKEASLGILQSPRGDKLTLPIFGPSGKQLLLN